MIPGKKKQEEQSTRSSAFSNPRLTILIIALIITLLAVILVDLLIPSMGTLDAITGYTPVNLTEHEREWILQHPSVRVCPDPAYPPFERLTDTGEYQGISAELLAEISKNTGLNIGVTAEDHWGTCVNNIKTGDSDILGAVYISNLRDDYLIYSKPFYRSLLPIITRNSVQGGITLRDLSGKKVASVAGFTTTLLLQQNYPEIRIVEVPDVKAGLESVSLGTADAYFGDLAASTWYVDAEGISNLHVAGSYEPENPDDFSYAFGIRRDYPELVGIINKGLEAIPPERRTEIFKKWISPTLSKPAISPVLLIVIIGIIGVLIIVIGTVVLWNRALSRVVERKTTDLSRELAEHKKTADILLMTRFTVDHSHAMILWLDAQGVIYDVNETICRAAGRSRESLIGESMVALYTHLTRQDVKQTLAEARTKGRIMIQSTIQDQSGGKIPVEAMIWYFTFEENEWFYIENKDLSERQAQEKSIKESEERYRGLFRNVNDAIFLFGFDANGLPGKILDANQVAEEMTGYPHDQLCSTQYVHLGITAHPDIKELDPYGCTTRRCTFEWEILTAAADIIPVEVNFHVFDREGVQFGLSLVRDITERRFFEAEREAAISQIQKNIAELSILNDGIRNPLTVILGTAETFCPTSYAVIEQQIIRIDGMIDQLDQRWNESEKILTYLKKHHGVTIQKPEVQHPGDQGESTEGP